MVNLIKSLKKSEKKSIKFSQFGHKLMNNQLPKEDMTKVLDFYEFICYGDFLPLDVPVWLNVQCSQKIFKI